MLRYLYMFKFIFSIIIILLNVVQLHAQDSLKVYELQPVEFSQKIGNDYWTVQNYFMKKRRFRFQKLRLGHLMYGDTLTKQPQAFGVMINIPKEGNKIIIKRLVYPSFHFDTLQLKNVGYMLLIQHRDSTYTEKHLTINESVTQPYKDPELEKLQLLNTVDFNMEAITLQDGDSVYMMRINNPPFHSIPTTHIYSSSINGKYTYKYENNKLTIIEKEDDRNENQNIYEPNQVWQTRITFRAYKE